MNDYSKNFGSISDKLAGRYFDKKIEFTDQLLKSFCTYFSVSLSIFLAVYVGFRQNDNKEKEFVECSVKISEGK